MVKSGRTRLMVLSKRIRAKPYKFPYSKRRVGRKMFSEDCPKFLEKRDWENVICSVCMECPHNAVLLLCSSHDKGCRPYMCGTSFRYSNCLDQYKKESAKVKSSSHQPNLICPLCRGQENCVFAGTFKELRKHMNIDHPCAQPREVNPDVEQNWRRLEIEHERDDVISTIRSIMPGAMVFGDYVIERNRNSHGSGSNEGGDHYNEGEIEGGIGRNLMNLFVHVSSWNQTSHSNSDTNNVRINRGTSVNFSGGEEEVEVERHSNSLVLLLDE